MKQQFFGIFFYLLYLLAMVRPVFPIIEYHVNYDYIASVLCENRDKPYLECNGKCYLQKRLNETNHTNHDHKSTIPQIDFEKYPISTLEQFSYSIAEFDNLLYSSESFKRLKTYELFDSTFKPPQV